MIDEPELQDWQRQERLRTQSPGLFSLSPKWVRYSRYEAVQDKASNWYVAPAKGAVMETYKPFECYPEILRDFLALKGKAAWNDLDTFKHSGVDSLEKQRQIKAQAIIPFAEKYGLLGLFWHDLKEIIDIFSGENTPEHWEPYLEAGERALVRATGAHVFSRDITPGVGNELHYNVTGFSKYAKAFFPRGMPPEIDKVRPLLDIPQFSQNYGEMVNSFGYGAYDVWRIADLWKRFCQGGFDPTDDYVAGNSNEWVAPDAHIRWSDMISSEVNIWPVGVSATFDNKWQLSWSFKSLLDALRIMAVMNIASEKQEVRSCFNCGHPFVAAHPKAQCCGKACSSTYRQRKYRQNRKKNAAKLVDKW